MGRKFFWFTIKPFLVQHRSLAKNRTRELLCSIPEEGFLGRLLQSYIAEGTLLNPPTVGHLPELVTNFLDNGHASFGAHQRDGEVGVAARAVPVARRGFRGEGYLEENPELFQSYL